MVLSDGVSSENADSYKIKLFNLSIGMRIYTFLHKAMEFPSSLKAIFGIFLENIVQKQLILSAIQKKC